MNPQVKLFGDVNLEYDSLWTRCSVQQKLDESDQ